MMGSEDLCPLPQVWREGNITHYLETYSKNETKGNENHFSLNDIKQWGALSSSGWRSGPFCVLSGDPEFEVLKQDLQKSPSIFMCAPMWLLNIKRHLLRKVGRSKDGHEHDQVSHSRGNILGKKMLPGERCWLLECFLSQLTIKKGANERKVF